MLCNLNWRVQRPPEQPPRQSRSDILSVARVKIAIIDQIPFRCQSKNSFQMGHLEIILRDQMLRDPRLYYRIYSGIPISRTLNFSNLQITRTQSSFPFSAKHFYFTPDFSNSAIFRTNFRFPWRFVKSGFHCSNGSCCMGMWNKS